MTNTLMILHHGIDRLIGEDRRCGTGNKSRRQANSSTNARNNGAACSAQRR